MSSRGIHRLLTPIIGALIFALAVQPQAAKACAACYGQSDSSMAQGLNWGIFSLLGVVVLVLGGIAAFFIFLVRKQSAAGSAAVPAPGELLSTDRI